MFRCFMVNKNSFFFILFFIFVFLFIYVSEKINNRHI